MATRGAGAAVPVPEKRIGAAIAGAAGGPAEVC